MDRTLLHLEQIAREDAAEAKRVEDYGAARDQAAAHLARREDLWIRIAVSVSTAANAEDLPTRRANQAVLDFDDFFGGKTP